MSSYDLTFRLVEAVRARIESGCPDIRDVEGVVGAARNHPPRTPAAIVYPLAEEIAANRGGRGAVVAPVTARIAVLHVIGAPNDPQGAVARAAAGACVAATRAAIMQWPKAEWLPGLQGPLVLTGGILEDIADGRLFWADRYTAEWMLGVQPATGV